MFLVNLKSSINRSLADHLIKRNISSSIICRTSTKLTPESNTFGIQKKPDENEVQSYEPLTEDEIKKIINVDNINVITKMQTKRPQRLPLLKNFFIGRIDREMLTYPQLDLKDVDAMVERINPIADYFVNNTKTPTELRVRDLSNEMLADFRSLKLFGSNVGEKYGGRGLFKGEMAWASESEANDVKSYLVLAGHRLAVEAIAEHGTESQQIEYLMEMAKGKIIGATCLHDPLSNTGTITATKKKTPSGDEYILNGSASWAVCSQHANLLIVVAKKSDSLLAEEEEGDFEDDIDYEDPCLTFALDAKTNGITFQDHSKTIGCDDVPFSTVNFINVRVPKTRLLSEMFDERHLSQKLNECYRLQMSVLNMVQAKKIINQIINFVIQMRCCGAKLMEQQFVLSDLSKNAMDIYALESMIYLTTGIIDDYDNPKVDLESAITKAFSQDILKNLLEFAFSIMGGSAAIGSEKIQQDLLNALQLLSLGGTSDALKKYVAIKGIQHCVEHYGNNTDDYKDSFLVKWGIAEPHIEKYRAKKRLGDFVHPTLEASADNVDESIYHLKCASEMLLSRYREKTLLQRIDLRNLGEMAMYQYGMFASIGRSSRGYCLGLRYAQYETVAAANFVFPVSEQMLDRVLKIKEEQNGIQDSEKAVIDSAKERYQKGMSPFSSVRQTRIMAKHDE